MSTDTKEIVRTKPERAIALLEAAVDNRFNTCSKKQLIKQSISILKTIV